METLAAGRVPAGQHPSGCVIAVLLSPSGTREVRDGFAAESAPVRRAMFRVRLRPGLLLSKRLARRTVGAPAGLVPGGPGCGVGVLLGGRPGGGRGLPPAGVRGRGGPRARGPVRWGGGGAAGCRVYVAV